MPSTINFTCPECKITSTFTTPEIFRKEHISCPNCDKEFKDDFTKQLKDGLMQIETMHQNVWQSNTSWNVNITSRSMS